MADLEKKTQNPQVKKQSAQERVEQLNQERAGSQSVGQQTGGAASAQERQEDTGKTEVEDFFRLDQDPAIRRDHAERRGENDDTSGQR